MKLNSISFIEYKGQDREWILHETHLDMVTLLVGRNASGKSRLLNVINALAKMLSAQLDSLYLDGNYHVRFSTEKHSYEYTLCYENKLVTKEVLSRDGNTLLERGHDGVGTIWAEQINQKINFEAPREQLAARVRRDKIQHPFLEDLNTWARLLRHYEFGTPFGRNFLMLIPMQEPTTTQDVSQTETINPNEVTKL